MKIEHIRIGVSPLTDRVFIGTARAGTDTDTWINKVDFTSKFIGAVMDWAPPGTTRIVRDNHGNQYEVEVRQVKAAPDPIPSQGGIGKEGA